MRERFMRFMIGRYGVDAFSRFLMWVAFAAIFVSVFTKISFLYYIAVVLIFYIYFRMFSRNIYKRAEENQRYLKMTKSFRNFFSTEKTKIEEKRKYRIYKCPNCCQKIRVPRGRGKIEITCPKCHIAFIKKS